MPSYLSSHSFRLCVLLVIATLGAFAGQESFDDVDSHHESMRHTLDLMDNSGPLRHDFNMEADQLIISQSLNPSFSGLDLFIRVIYHFQLDNHINLSHDKLDNTPQNFESIHGFLSQECESTIFMFPIDQIMSANYSQQSGLCGLTNLNLTSPETIYLKLLPGQCYTFHFAVYLNGVLFHPEHSLEHESYSTINCINGDIPLTPPRTGEGSFIIDEVGEDSRVVTIFWRATPAMLAGHAKYNYSIICHRSESFNQASNLLNTSSNLSYLKFSIPTDVSVDCSLQTKNPIGLSNRSSLIHIPTQMNIIHLDVNRQDYIVAAALPDSTYKLRWATIDELLPYYRSIHSNHDVSLLAKQRVDYTVYWSFLDREKNHLSPNKMIDGLVKTTEANMTIRFPDTDRKRICLFGISYKIGDYYSGIKWSSHPATEFTDDSGPYILSMSANVTQVVIKWDFASYETWPAIYPTLDFECCPKSYINLCSQSDSAYQLDDSKCITKIIDNDILTREVTIDGLNPSTMYTLKVKATSQHTGNQTKWSQSFSFQTLNHSSIRDNCNLQEFDVRILFGLPILAFTMISLLMLAYGVTKKSYEFHLHFKEARAALPEEFKISYSNDKNLSQSSLRYWIDYMPSDHKTIIDKNSSLNKTSISWIEQTQTNLSEQMNEQIDYIKPSQVTTSQSKLTSGSSTNSLKFSENYTNSELDDISIISHKSFIRRILS